MADTAPSMKSPVAPQEKPTVEMAPPPPWAIALSQKVSDGFEVVETRLTTIEANQSLQGGQVLDVGKRMTAVEERLGKVEERQNTNSVRVKSTTDNDLKQDSDISRLIVKVAGLEATQAKQLDILERLDKVAANPKVKMAAKALFYLIVAAAAAKGWILK